MADIGLSIASKVAEFLVYPVLKHLKYLCCYKSNMENLRNEIQILENKKVGVERRVNDAKSNAEDIDEEVSAWLEKVNLMKTGADELLTGATDLTRCSNLNSCYLLSRKAVKKTDEAIKLQQKGKFDRIGYPAPLNRIPKKACSDNDKGLRSRHSTRREIMQALREDQTYIIGIWGMAGVGKTTMVNDIAALVRTDKLFNQIAMTVVSKHQDIKNVQDQLAESLGLKIEEQVNVDVRAQRLYRRIMQDNKSTLLILDDLWQLIGLEVIGIPSPTDRNGLKILLTSRFLEVCQDMRAQTNIKVEVLPTQEAWSLFQETAEVSADIDVKSVAEDVAKECRGLPLALVTVGNALKHKKKDIWDDALKQLQNSAVTTIRGVHEIVYKSIRLSYDFLGNEAKKLLLHCTLFPEDHNIPIESLVRHGWGLKLFDSIGTLAETRKRVDNIVDHLKNCSLLITDGDYYVKLHEVVRDVCLSIASSKNQDWKVKHAGLQEWPEQEEHEDFAAISLTFDKLDRLPSGSKFPVLQLLRLVCNSDYAIRISDGYFEEMKVLRIAEFSRMKIEIPSSLQFLTSLKTLCLEFCIVEGDISILGSLTKLEILSFYESYLHCSFPIEIGKLSKLRSFDLRFPNPSGDFQRYRRIPNGVLLGLKKLEELYLGHIRGSDEYLLDCITEMSSLSCLSNFQICSDDVQLLLKALHEIRVENLQRFHVVKSPESDHNLDYGYGRSLYLDNVHISVIKDSALNSLLKRSDVLTLDKIHWWNNSMNQLDEDGFINLKKLTMRHSDIKYLIDTSSFVSQLAFTKLEVMELEYLRELIRLWKGPIQPPSFCSLTHLTIRSCHEIRSVFVQSMVKCLTRLQYIEIGGCRMLEEIVSKYTKGSFTTEIVCFPKLTHLRIFLDVPNLRSFSCQRESLTFANNKRDVSAFFSQEVMLPSLETMQISIPFCYNFKWIIDEHMPTGSLHNLTSLSVKYCQGLSGIGRSNWMKQLHNLESLSISRLANLKVLFDFKSLQVDEGEMEVVFGHLEILLLSMLTELACLCSICPKEIRAFQNLKSMSVEECHRLTFLFSPSVAEMLVSLEDLVIGSCELMMCIVEKETEIDKQKYNQIILPKLGELILREMPTFNMFCQAENCKLELPSLTELYIDYCPAMEKLCFEQLIAPQRSTVNLGNVISVPLEVYVSQL